MPEHNPRDEVPRGRARGLRTSGHRYNSLSNYRPPDEGMDEHTHAVARRLGAVSRTQAIATVLRDSLINF